MQPNNQNFKYLFGPVPSRRLGRSLGIDLVPLKVCSYDCIYCQLGHTTHKTLERREWVPTDEVIAELERWFANGGEADAITLAGSGEPTLHTGFGDVLRAARRLCDARGLSATRLVLLTNGSLLHLPEVRKAAALAQIVKVTLSASLESMWNLVHRPADGLRFPDILESLKTFRREFAGELWLEVMLMGGVNAAEEEVRRIAALTAEIHPERIQLNTPVRPPAEAFASPLPKAELDRLALFFDPPAEVIGEFHAKETSAQAVTVDAVMSLLRRHPCSSADVAAALGSPEEPVREIFQALLKAGLVKAQETDDTTCYSVVAELKQD